MKRKKKNKDSVKSVGGNPPVHRITLPPPPQEDAVPAPDMSSFFSRWDVLLPTTILAVFFVLIFLFWTFPPKPVKINVQASFRPSGTKSAKLSWDNKLGYDPKLFEEVSDNDIPDDAAPSALSNNNDGLPAESAPPDSEPGSVSIEIH